MSAVSLGNWVIEMSAEDGVWRREQRKGGARAPGVSDAAAAANSSHVAQEKHTVPTSVLSFIEDNSNLVCVTDWLKDINNDSPLFFQSL